MEDIEKTSTAEKERITSKTNSAIERLMAEKIPDSLPKAERAKRIAERNEKIAKLRSDSKAAKSKVSEESQSSKEGVRSDATARKQQVSEETKEDRAANSANASVERKQVARRLKSAISAAREAYKAAKESLDSSYEEIYQREFDKIAAEMPKVSKRKSSQKKK